MEPGSKEWSIKGPRMRGEIEALKMLVIWWWAPKNAKEVTDRFSKWKRKGKWETLYPTSTMIGMNKGFMVVDADDIAEMQKDVVQWTDICTFKFIPIMDTREAIAVSV